MTWVGGAASSPLTVAHVVCPTGCYGAERWILTLARHLDRRRIDLLCVTVGASEGAHEAHRIFRAAGIPAIHIPHGGKISVSAVRTLRSLLRRRGVRVLHAHGFKADTLGYLASRWLSVKLVSTPHGWSSDEGWRIAAYEAIGRTFMRRFDRVYPLSGSLEADLLRRDFRREQVRLVPNAVDDEPLHPIFLERQRAQQITRGMVLFIGRLVESKGVFELLEAFARATLPPGTELRLVGEGPARESLLQRAAELGIAGRVGLSGYVADVRDVLQRADTIVLPSYSEGLPRVLMEAAAAAVPIIATDIPGIRQLLVHDTSALLVAPRDPIALAAALQRMFSDRDLRVRLAREARRTIEERHTAARQARDFETEYLTLCQTTG